MKDLLPNVETYSLSAKSSSATESDPEADQTEDTSTRPDIAAAPPTREPVRVILVGSGTSTNLVIGILHSLGFAEARAWSKPQVDPASGKPMRILTKWVRS